MNNIRRALTDHPAVRRLIEAENMRFEIMNRGERAYMHGAISIPGEELAPVMRKRQEALTELMSRKVGRNDPCPCGRGKKYKRCCGA